MSAADLGMVVGGRYRITTVRGDVTGELTGENEDWLFFRQNGSQTIVAKQYVLQVTEEQPPD